MTSTLRTFVSLTPLLQGPTFIAAGAGPAGQGAGCPTGIHCQSSVCSFRVGPTDGRILLPSTMLTAVSLLQRCVLSPGAARSLQGSLGCSTGKGSFSPGSTGTVLQQFSLTLPAVPWHWALTDTLRTTALGRGDHSLSLPDRGRRRLTCLCLGSDLLCCAAWRCLRNSIHQLFVG